jgi:hypothetical protein
MHIFIVYLNVYLSVEKHSGENKFVHYFNYYNNMLIKTNYVSV